MTLTLDHIHDEQVAWKLRQSAGSALVLLNVASRVLVVDLTCSTPVRPACRSTKALHAFGHILQISSWSVIYARQR